MIKLKVILTSKQKKYLIGLLTSLKIVKHFRLTDKERNCTRDNIKATFDILDKLNVPFYIQNAIIRVIDNNKREFLLESCNNDLLKLALKDYTI